MMIDFVGRLPDRSSAGDPFGDLGQFGIPMPVTVRKALREAEKFH